MQWRLSSIKKNQLNLIFKNVKTKLEIRKRAAFRSNNTAHGPRLQLLASICPDSDLDLVKLSVSQDRICANAVAQLAFHAIWVIFNVLLFQGFNFND